MTLNTGPVQRGFFLLSRSSQVGKIRKLQKKLLSESKTAGRPESNNMVSPSGFHYNTKSRFYNILFCSFLKKNTKNEWIPLEKNRKRIVSSRFFFREMKILIFS